MAVTIRIKGLDDLRTALARAGPQAPAALAGALKSQAETIMTTAKRRTPVGGGPYSPNDPHPGQLRGSGTVLHPRVSGSSVSVTLGFGGAAKDYALRQHEHTEYRHHVGRSKYLESAMIDAAPTLASALARRVTRLFPPV